MVYSITVIDDEALNPVRQWSETNKDEVIAVLVMLLLEHDYEVRIVYPDGSGWG